MKTITKQKNKKTIQHPLFGVSLKNWLQLLENNGGIDARYFGRGFFITLSSIGTAPARALFKINYEKKIMETQIQHPPVIIIGHWRSGTTYLHELLSYDSQFCYITLWNTLLPNSFLTLEPLKPLFAGFLPPERPMDSIKVNIDGPYEEEAGIAVLSQWSFFHCLHFARNAEEQYLKSIHFNDLKPAEINQWKQNYLTFMKAVTYANNGKRLLLKNPANTARIPTLLELFPNAKFIHIYRNPYKVYLSTIKMRNRVLDKLALQNANQEEIKQQVTENYKRLMKSYFEQKKHIPKENLVDVKYENLVANPIKEVKKIYTQLDLPDLQSALPEMQRYLEKQKDYKTNVYRIDEQIMKHVKNNWKFTIDLWKYDRPK
jgi:hypothetical protein